MAHPPLEAEKIAKIIKPFAAFPPILAFFGYSGPPELDLFR
jgi:hypothetical protein